MDTIIRFIVEHWKTISNSPWLSALVVVVAVFLLLAFWIYTAWLLGKWYFGRQINILQLEIHLLGKRLAFMTQRYKELRARYKLISTR